MPPGDSRLSPAILWLIVLAGSLFGLAVIWFVIVPLFCAGRGSGFGDCGQKIPVVYLCSALFLGATLYSGYRLARAIVREESSLQD